MKVVILGNAGSGKSTLARRLATGEPIACLSLDQVAFAGGSERRPLRDSVADAERFIAENDSWIIEGCYADIVEPLLKYVEELVFLNPGIEACVSHCRARPWEPEKFASSEEQDQGIEGLIAWVRAYQTRTDEYGLARHRALFESFRGCKRELADPSQYGVD